jgi:hypothetical protein
MLMQGVVAVPSRAKRDRSKAGALPGFFAGKIKTLLLRTRSVVHALSADVGRAAAVVLDDLDQFANVRSLQDVFDILGGEKKSLAARIFVSVTDVAEKRQLELYAGVRNEGKRQELILNELCVLLEGAQELAKELPEDNELAGRVLALKVPLTSAEEEDDDEGGTGEQEVPSTEGRKKRKKANVQPKKKQKPPSRLKQRKKQTAQTARKPDSVLSQKKAKPAAAKEKEVVAVAADVQEEVFLVEEEPSSSDGLSQQEVLRLLEEAEGEFSEVQKIANGGSVAAPQLDVPTEGPPNVDQLIRGAALENVTCLVEKEVPLNTAEARMSLQMWWRIAKRSCQIHGLFLLLRSQKSKISTLRERYALLVTKLSGALSFIQASRYDRIGCLLARFPLFIYQRKWTTVADWFEKLLIATRLLWLIAWRQLPRFHVRF